MSACSLLWSQWCNDIFFGCYNIMDESKDAQYAAMQQNWDFRIHEAAQRSITSADYLLSCISDRAYKRGHQELGLIAAGVVLEFKKFLSIINNSCQYLTSSKRIKKGPLFNGPSIDPSELTEKVMSSPISFNTKQSIYLPRQFLGHSMSFNSGCQSQPLMVQRCYSDTNLTLAKNPLFGLDGSVSQASSTIASGQKSASSLSLQLTSFDKTILQSNPEDFSIKFGGREEGSSKCAAFAGGCRCSKRRWIIFYFEIEK